MWHTCMSCCYGNWKCQSYICVIITKHTNTFWDVWHSEFLIHGSQMTNVFYGNTKHMYNLRIARHKNKALFKRYFCNCTGLVIQINFNRLLIFCFTQTNTKITHFDYIRFDIIKKICCIDMIIHFVLFYCRGSQNYCHIITILIIIIFIKIHCLNITNETKT